MSIAWVDGSRFARRTRVIAVADVVESVRLMEQDEQEFIRRWHGFVAFAKQHLPLETGRMHKSLGDGLMMEFDEPDGCIRASLALQAWFHEGNQGLPADAHVHLRIGAHMAEFVADEHDIYGTDVNLAARIATLAGPGEIVISAALRQRINGSLAHHIEDLGECFLKHVRQPVRAFRVGAAGGAPVLPAGSALRWQARPAVAVLPFGGEGADADIGEAIADEAIAVLTGSSELQVVSRMSTAAFRPESATLDAMAQHFRAHYVLRGQVRRSADRIALFAELTDASTGHVAWARSFKCPASELLVRDAGLVQELVAGVTSGVIAREVERSQGQPLPALASHTLLLGAIARMHRLAPAEIDRAEEMLEHLVDRNRRHAAVHAWLAHCRVLRVLQRPGPPPQQEAQLARESALAALRADPHLPLALCMDGFVQVHVARDLDLAAMRYRQVLSAHRREPLALAFLAELAALRGDGQAALPMARQAAQLCTLEPMRYLYDHVLALATLVAGDPQRAVQHAEGALAAQPLFLPGHATLAIACVEAGDVAQAQMTVLQWSRQQPGLSVARFLAQCPAQPPLARRMAAALAQAGMPA